MRQGMDAEVEEGGCVFGECCRQVGGEGRVNAGQSGEGCYYLKRLGGFGWAKGYMGLGV